MNHLKNQKHQRDGWREARRATPWHPSEGVENGVGMGGDEGKSREINVRGQGVGQAGVEV